MYISNFEDLKAIVEIHSLLSECYNQIEEKQYSGFCSKDFYKNVDLILSELHNLLKIVETIAKENYIEKKEVK